MAIPKRTITATCDIDAGTLVFGTLGPVFTGEVAAASLEISLIKGGSAYSPSGVLAEIYLFWPGTPNMTETVEMTISGSTLSSNIPDIFTAVSGTPLMVLQLTDEGTGDLIVAAAAPISITNVRGGIIISSRAPTPSEIVYVGRAPYVDPTTHKWYEWDPVTHNYVDTGVYAAGAEEIQQAIEAAEAANTAATAANTKAGLADTAATRANAAAASAENMTGLIAPTWVDNSSLANVGDPYVHNGALYWCITPITTAETWTASHWSTQPVAKAVTDLKSAIKLNNNYVNKNAEDISGLTKTLTLMPLATKGGYKNDGFYNSNTCIRNAEPIPAGTYRFTTKNGALGEIYKYDTDSHGVAFAYYRELDNTFTLDAPFYITIKKSDESIISPDEYYKYFTITQTISGTPITTKIDNLTTKIDNLVSREYQSGTDLDTLINYGWYLVTYAIHAPSEYEGGTIYLEVLNFNNGTAYILQRVYRGGSINYPSFIRMKFNNGAWTDWKQEGDWSNKSKSILTSFDLNTQTEEGSFITTAFTNGPIDSDTAIITNTRVADGWIFQTLTVYNSFRKTYSRVNRGEGNYGTWYNISTGYNNLCVNMGDSIYGNNRGNTSISFKLSKLTGWTVINGGAGGCRMTATADNNYQRFSMVELADAIASGDFTDQIAAAAEMGSYYSQTAAELAALDWSEVTRITISYGTNDWSADIPIGSDSISDETITTFKGALRYSLHKLSAAYPNAIIFVCGLFNRFDLETTGTPDGSEWQNGNGDTVLDFCHAAEEVAKQYSVRYVDQFYIGMNKYNFVPYHYENDGTHLNSLGCDIAASNLFKQIY